MYKLGPFYLTTLNFSNPMFVYKNNENKHPTTLAAVMTSVTKEERDYRFIASCLKNAGVSSLTYGTDGEYALERGFESVFPIEDGSQRENIHLRCFLHAKNDISRKLTALNVGAARKTRITEDILGKESDGKRIKGLVDCENAEDFEQMYVDKESDWPEEFKKWMVTERGD